MRILTGIQSSGKLHIGNYFGAIKPILDYQEEENELFTFIADYHALTTSKDPKTTKQNTLDAVIDYLSLGIDPNKTTFFLQSDVPQLMELYFILSKLTPMGLLERSHSYKDKVEKGFSTNHALFSYPVLMAADILMFDVDKVPVGKDQIQHLEMTREIAKKFNNEFGETFKLPNVIVNEETATIPGTNGKKMSKSYNNTIDIFHTEKELTKKCNKIITDSTELGTPVDYETSHLYKMSALFLNKEEQKELQERYLSGKEGYGHFKKYLKELIYPYFNDARERREHYLSNIDEVYEILDLGALKANSIASKKMIEVRRSIGLGIR